MIELGIYAFIGAGLGLYWIYSGFQELKSKRIIQDIPTSSIATGAVGANVEVKGKIAYDPEQLFRAPLSGKQCAFYAVTIQELHRSKNRETWRTIDKFYSDKGFLLEDGSGASARVLVEGATYNRKGGLREFRVHSTQGSDLPPSLYQGLLDHEQDLKSFKLNKTSWFSSNQYRFLEWCFMPGEPIYVLGYADSGFKSPKKRKLKFKTFLKAKKLIESNPQLQDKFDANNDRTLDPEELERGAEVMGWQLQSREQTEPAETLLPKTKMVFKKHGSYPFIISNRKESEIEQNLAWTSTFKLIGGPVVTLASLFYIFFAFTQGLLSNPFEVLAGLIHNVQVIPIGQ